MKYSRRYLKAPKYLFKQIFKSIEILVKDETTRGSSAAPCNGSYGTRNGFPLRLLNDHGEDGAWKGGGFRRRSLLKFG